MASVSDRREPAWEPIPGCDGAFTLARVVDSGWSWRAVAVALSGGGLALYSPVKGTLAATADWLEARGGVRFVLAPNHHHYLAVPETLERFPDARFVASKVAAPRLERKLGLPVGDLASLAEALPTAAEVLAPPGLKSGEAWLRIASGDGVAWVVSDAFFNVTRALHGGFGLAVRLIDAGPGLRIGRTFKLLSVGDRPAYRTWLRERLAGEAVRVLVPSHGEVLEDGDLPARLAALVEKRL